MSASDGAVGQLDAATSPRDTGIDSAASDAGTTCRLDQSYRFSSASGLDVRNYELSRDGVLGVRSPLTDGGITRCEITVPACGNQALDIGELASAFSASDVVAAYADSPEPFGFVNNFISDEIYREITREDGRRIRVGRPCEARPGCRAIPEGVLELSRIIDQLLSAEASLNDCSR